MLPPQRKQYGVTLVELIVSMSIAAVLAATAVPSFSDMLKNNTRRTQVDSFWHAIFLARSEAIKRNSVVVLCKRGSNGRCDNSVGNWAASGWLVFDNLDHDEPAQLDPGEPILHIYDASTRFSVTSNRQTFSFRPVAQGAVNGTIVFCDSRGSGAARAIIISHTGRPRQSKVDASNHALQCPSV